MRTQDFQRILVARLSSMGDIVLTTPLIRGLRRRFPKARIDFVVKREFAELLCTNPHLTNVYEYDSRTGAQGLFALGRHLRSQRYELFVDLHNNLRTRLLRLLMHPGRIVTFSKHVIKRTLLVKTGINLYGTILQVPDRYLRTLQPFGVENDGKGLELFPTEVQRTKVQTLFRQHHLTDGDLAIGLGPIAAHPLKQWPRFAGLGQELVQRYGARILLFGGPADVQYVQAIAEQIPNAPILLCGQLSRLESAAALQRCALYVGNDTGTVHIATAMQRKVVVIFGPTVEEFGFYPYNDRSIVVSKPLPCRPCTHTGNARCKIKTHACMQAITTPEVVEAVEKVLFGKLRSS